MRRQARRMRASCRGSSDRWLFGRAGFALPIWQASWLFSSACAGIMTVCRLPGQSLDGWRCAGMWAVEGAQSENTH